MQLISGRLLIRNISDRCSQAATSKLADIYVSVSRSRRQKCFLQGDSEVAALNPPSFGRIGEDCCLVWNRITVISWPEDTRTHVRTWLVLRRSGPFSTQYGYLSGG